MASTSGKSRNIRKRREGQHNRRQDAHDPVDQASQVGGGLAPGRGDGLDSATSPSAPTPTGGGLASNRDDNANAGVTSAQNHDTPAAPTTEVHTTPAQDNNQDHATSTPPAPVHNNNNDNNGNQNNQQTTTQWNQHTTSSQQQWHQPSTSSYDNGNTWQNQNTNNGNTMQQSSQQHNTWQQMSSSSSAVDPASSSHPVLSSVVSSEAVPLSNTGTAAAASASATPPTSAVNGIVDTANAVDPDASAMAAKPSKLGAGGTAGIVIAIIAVLGLVAAFFLYRRRKRDQRARDTRQYGNVRIMSERFSTGSSFYGVPNASTGSGGFITFHDNASTHTHATTVLPGSPSGGSMIYNAPAPAPQPGALLLREERPDEDDVSHYDHDTVDSHGDLGQASSAYYAAATAMAYDNRPPYMPEYNLPTPPIPAFDSQEAIMASRASSNNMAGTLLFCSSFSSHGSFHLSSSSFPYLTIVARSDGGLGSLVHFKHFLYCLQAVHTKCKTCSMRLLRMCAPAILSLGTFHRLIDFCLCKIARALRKRHNSRKHAYRSLNLSFASIFVCH